MKYYFALLLSMLVAIFSSCKHQGTSYDSDDNTMSLNIEDDETGYEGVLDDNVDELYGGWEKSYFKDEFGEIDYSNPCIALWVPQGGNNVNLGVLYRPSGTFAFKLFDKYGEVESIYGSSINMSIRVNGQDIGPVSIPVEDNEFYLYGDDSAAMSTIFNEGSFAISIRYESYNYKYHYVFNVNEAKGSFERAVTQLLGSVYRGE